MNITERKYLNLFDNFVSSIVILDKELRILFFNKHFTQLTGFSPKRIKKGTPFFDVFPVDKEKKIFDEVLKTGEMSANIEIEATDKDGQIIKVLTNLIPLDTQGKPVGILMNMIDISVEARLHKKYMSMLDKEAEAKKDMRMQLIQAEKMSSLGTLVSGICHELNNPLAIVMASSELLRSKNVEQKEELSHSIGEAAKRMSSIVNKLRIFSRKASEQFEIIYINKIINDILMLFGRHLELQEIRLVKNLSEHDPKIWGDDNLIGQVIMNLISNAAEAMEKTDVKELNVSSELDEDRLKIVISDTGVGINENIKDRIFDPFFTTKDPNKGTGLGLSIVYQILKLHNASIELVDRPEGGASFVISFQTLGSKTESEKEEDKHVLLKDKKVLFVDDEENLLKLIEYMFKDYFSEVYTAESAAEALKILQKKPFDLIITDVKMPEMDGYELARICKKDYSGIPIISLSGSDSVKRSADKLELFDSCIEKPFSREDIFSAISKVFGKKA